MEAGQAHEQTSILLNALGIAPESFGRFLQWALSEHLVSLFAKSEKIGADFFSRQDALKAFRELLQDRSGRHWSHHDVEVLFERVKAERTTHFRQPIVYEEYLKLLWQVPLECVRCKRRPPEVKLHIDHIVPASRGGVSRRPNLQFLCAPHNLEKSNKREVTDSWLDFQ
jgi:hypothetical protein